MKGGMATTFFLFHRRGESKIKQLPFPDLGG